MSYKFLEHTSDIIIEAEGSSFENALEEVANGMITQMGSKKAKKSESIRLEIEERENKEDMVVAVLSEIVAVCDYEPFTPASARIKKADKKIEVELKGERKPPENIIKAVTYHGLKIERIESGWRITVLFDI